MWFLQLCLSMAHAWNEPAIASQWYVVNDSVMGGISQSSVTEHPDEGLVFSGVLSLENNGGFASTRTEKLPSDWSTASALQMKIVGDGRSYIATVRTPSRALRRVYYRQAFDTTAGTETTITLPLENFEAYTFGRRVPSAPSLAQARSQIGSAGIMLADKNEGPFSLRILSLSTVAGEVTTTPQAPSARRALVQAIERGVPLFNQGDADRCADVYATTLTTLLLAAPDTLTEGQRQRFAMALQEAQRTESDVDRAWILRRAIDASGLATP